MINIHKNNFIFVKIKVYFVIIEEQKPLLSCSFRRDQIYNTHCYVFSYTL